MRATAMDELPQLWNIFRGDMSFVGPRALRPGEIETAATANSSRSTRFPAMPSDPAVRPGLTGVAQIYAPRDVARRNKFRFDCVYVQTRKLLARRPPDPAVVLDYLPRQLGRSGGEGLI